MIDNIAKKILISLSFDEEKHFRHAFSSMPGRDSIGLIDVGAAGDVEPRWKKIEHFIEYFGFEPDARSLSELENKANNLKRRKLFDTALWDHEESIDFNLCVKPQVSSHFTPNFDWLDNFPDKQRFDIKKQLSLECIPLDNLDIEPSDFIKIDVQGGELSVLKGAANTLNKILGAEVEVEFLQIYQGQPLFGEICDFMSSFGFEFIDFTNICRWERNRFNDFGQSVFGDGLFLKPPEYVLENHNDINCLSAYLKILLLYKRFDLIDVLLEGMLLSDRNLFEEFEVKIIPIKRASEMANKISRFAGRIVKIFGGNNQTHLIY
jgi:FkbM family methyltransferase